MVQETLRVSAAAAKWGLRFYARRPLLVFGLSLIPTVQRFWVITTDLPDWVDIGSEVVVGLARLLLFALIARGALAEERLDVATAWARLKAAISDRPAVFGLQFAVLGVAFVLLDLVPNAVIATWVPATDQELVTAVLVAVKNPTVIAFTFLWEVGVARTLIVARTPASVQV